MYTEEQVNYLIDFLVRNMPFNQRMKLYQEVKRFQGYFEQNKANDDFPGVEALKALSARYSPQIELVVEPMTLAGRLANGAERDHGQVVHAVREGDALCGAKPGRRSVGWVLPYPEDKSVNCPKCLARVKALSELIKE